jgi:putative transposase
MFRARLFFLPDVVWHITHRCHDRSFLLKFQKDKKCWLNWLFKAKKYYGLCILNYAITSNHIHLLVYADERRWVIPRSMQLVAGRTAWEYNQRKKRRGAFWEDPYHATAVQSDHHLLECMVYIDLNMVRTGVVDHPLQWLYGGYHELMAPKRRYRLIDHEKLMELMQIKNLEQTRSVSQALIHAALERNDLVRDKRWTGSIAVGSESFVTSMKEKLGYKARYRTAVENKVSWTLEE